MLACNCTIIGEEGSGDAVVVDPGGDAEKILAALARHKLTARMIIHTHAHIDHVGATKEIKEASGAEVLLHPDDLFLYENLEMQSRMLRLPPVTAPPLDAHLSDGQEIHCGGKTLLS